MPVEISLTDILGQPDHEQRCDQFVTAVLTEVAPKFPGVTIEAINKTKEEIEFPDTPDLPSCLQALMPRLKRIAQKADGESANRYRAVVDIWGYDGPRARNVVLRARRAVKVTAARYDPQDSLIISDVGRKTEIPNAHMVYTFAAQGSTKEE